MSRRSNGRGNPSRGARTQRRAAERRERNDTGVSAREAFRALVGFCCHGGSPIDCPRCTDQEGLSAI